MKRLLATIAVLFVLAPGAQAQPPFARCMSRVHRIEAGERTHAMQQAARSFCLMRYR